MKRCAIITYKHGIYKLPHKLTNYLRPTAFSPLGGLANTRKEKDSDHRIVGYIRIVPKPHRTPAQHASPRPNESPERYPPLPHHPAPREKHPRNAAHLNIPAHDAINPSHYEHGTGKQKYSSYTNHLRFSLRCHHNKILPKDLQLKRRTKTKIIFLLLQERIHINHAIRDRLKKIIEQLKGKILESITPEDFHVVEKIHENSYKKSFELTKKRHIQKFNELISKNKVTQSANNITDKNKWVINMSSTQLTHIETDLLAKGLITSQLLLKHCLIKMS